MKLYISAEHWIVAMIGALVANEHKTSEMKRAIERVAKISFIHASDLRPLLLDGWKQAVEQALQDHVLTTQEETTLYQIARIFSLSDEEMKKDGVIARVDKAVIIRNIMQGVVPEFPLGDLRLPFNFQKSEKVVWLFANVDYYEQRARTKYMVGSNEVSASIAMALYLKTTEVSAEVIESEETVQIDSGILAITTQHIYFVGASKSVRTNYRDIVSFKHYSNGIGFVQDSQQSAPKAFVTDDGWFAYNLITNLARRV
ncbi:MAG: hypothetical protein OXI77_14930 [Chloroflexota bacterium]|nr:hypothetical protein [Chloroflexota bacterium]